MKCHFVPKRERERGVRRPWKHIAFSSDNEEKCRGSCWVYRQRHGFPLSKKERTYDWRNGKRIHYTLEWTPGASCNLCKKSLNRFYKGHPWHLVTKTGVDRFEKCLSTKITSAFFLIYIRMCLLQDLDDLRISSLYFIANYIQVLCNFAEDRFV